MLNRDFTNSKKKEEKSENDDDDDVDLESSLMFLTMSNASITSKRSGGDFADGGAGESGQKKGTRRGKGSPKL